MFVLNKNICYNFSSLGAHWYIGIGDVASLIKIVHGSSVASDMNLEKLGRFSICSVKLIFNAFDDGSSINSTCIMIPEPRTVSKKKITGVLCVASNKM